MDFFTIIFNYIFFVTDEHYYLIYKKYWIHLILELFPSMTTKRIKMGKYKNNILPLVLFR